MKCLKKDISINRCEEMQMVDYLNFCGKKILVAGASSGIGRQTAITISRLGASVILIARREEKLQQVLSELDGNGHAYYCLDLSDLSSIEPGFKQIVLENGPIDGLVYAAGVDISLPLQLFKPEKMQEVFSVNYFGFIETVRQVCRKGRFNPGMRIVGLSSIAAKCGDKTHTAYSASKAAMDASVRCLAKELAARDIHINTIAPAMTDTDIYQEFYTKHGEEAKQELEKRQFLGIGNVEDVANAIAFLLSEGARFMTGSCMAYDGGFTAC